jgi:CheY-like chemotaxis protein/phosphoribosyl 1,2-cyclic phosphodiesterase
MHLKFWGTRGSTPTPGRSTLEFGGNTPCAEIRTDDGTLIILDCGTGIRELGISLLKEIEEKGPIVGHILLSHTHWDHTQGLLFFNPIFVQGNRFILYGAPGVDQNLKKVLSSVMDYTYFPITLDKTAEAINFQEVGEGAFNIGDIKIETCFLNHTVLTLGYRLQIGDATIVYATDHEPYSPVPWLIQRLSRQPDGPPGPTSSADFPHLGDRQHIHFLRGADLVIHDAQYTLAEYAAKRNWGHSPAEYATAVAVVAGAKRLALYHHDLLHTDHFLESMEQRCQQWAAAQGSPLDIFVAREGQEIYLPERAEGQQPDDSLPPPPQTGELYLPRRPVILVVDDSKPMVDIIRDSLKDDNYEIITASDGEEAIEAARQHHPDLILLDISMPRMDGYQVTEILKSDAATRDIPIAMLTVLADEVNVERGFELGVADYIDKPVSTAMLRARVRNCLLRAKP